MMIHPSYTELMQKINTDIEPGEEPVINSRYSIVLASAKRARQIVTERNNEKKNGVDPEEISKEKPLSVAVKELYDGDVKILGEDDMPEDKIAAEDVEE